MSTIKAGKIQPPNDSDSLQIFTNTVQRMTVTSGGLVGIGTVTPTAKLQTIDTYNAARFGANNINSLTIGSHGGSPYSGIGYNVNFDSGADNQYFAVGGDRTSLIRFTDGGFEFKGNATNGAISGTPFALTEYMTILKSGNVGIGIVSPDSPLHVLGAQNYGSAANSGIVTIGNANNSRQINLGVSDTNSVVYIEGWVPGTGGSHIVLQPSGGRVGIGITAPSVALDVVGNIKASTSLVLGSATMEAPSGTAPIFGARAYGYIPSTLATATKPPYSENVASITRVSANITKVTFITPMPHAFYTVVGMSRYIPTFANQPQIFISPAYLSNTAIQPNTTTEMYFTVWDNNANDGQALGYNNISETSFVIYC